MHRLIAACAIAAATLAAAAEAAAQQPPQWSAPALLVTSAGQPTIALTASGHGLITWSHSADVFGHTVQRAAERRPDGAVGPARDVRVPIEPPFVYGRDRAVALVSTSWGARRVRVVFGTTSGRFGAEQTIHTARGEVSGTIARMAVNARGDIAVAQLAVGPDDRRRIVLRERRAGRAFGPPVVVDELAACTSACRGRGPGSALEVALGPRGELVIAWFDGVAVRARVRRAGGALGPARRVGGAASLRELRAAVSARGAVWIGWMTMASINDGRGPFAVRLATRPAGAARFDPPRVVDYLRDAFIGFGGQLRLALAAGGRCFVAWTRGGLGPAGPGVRLATFDPSGGPAAPARSFTAPGTGSRVAALAAGPAGQALLAWNRWTGEEGAANVPMAALVDGDGSGEEERVAGSGLVAAAAFEPRSGVPIVFWQDRGDVLASTRRPPP